LNGDSEICSRHSGLSRCKTPVELLSDESGLECVSCRRVYPVRDEIPVMLRKKRRSPRNKRAGNRKSKRPHVHQHCDAVPRLKRLIPRLRGKRIGVLGDLMLDRYLWGRLRDFRRKRPFPWWISWSKASAWRSRERVRKYRRARRARGSVWGYRNDEPGALCKNVFAPRTSVTKAPVRLADLRRQGEAPAARRVQDPAGDKTRRQHASRIGFCSRRRECGSCVEGNSELQRGGTHRHPVQSERQDGRRTEGLAVPKSNWANTIDTPPFEAYAVTCGITFSFGGLRSIAGAQVINSDGQPMRGCTPRASSSGESSGSTTPAAAASPTARCSAASPERTPRALSARA